MTSGTQSVMIAVVALAAIAALARLNELLVYRMGSTAGGSGGSDPVSEASVLAIRSDINRVREAVDAQGVVIATIRTTVDAHQAGFDQFVTGFLNGPEGKT